MQENTENTNDHTSDSTSQKSGKKTLNRNVVLLSVMAMVIILSFGIMAFVRATAKPKLEVVVQYLDTEIFRAPLDKDAMYMIKDAEVTKVPDDTTLASMGDEALETRHHINLMQVKDGAVSVVESNCSNQVCVSIGQLTGSDYDFPITCLPHGLIIVIE